MYHTVVIEKLSENQLSRLRNRHPVRLKLGNHHNIHLSIQQLKNYIQHQNAGKHQLSSLTRIKKRHTAVEYLAIFAKSAKEKAVAKVLLAMYYLLQETSQKQ